MNTPATSIRRVVLDTDTYNEVDDQFALTHLLLAPGVSLEAVYAAPFLNDRSTSPADGMEKSYEEIIRLLDLVRPAKRPAIFRGSTQYLPDAQTPVRSEAVDDLIERAMATKPGEKLYVVGIAVATNLASALLLEPRIAEHIELVWLGGHAPYWPHTREFNLQQDLHAARILLDTEAPFVLVPCFPVSSHMRMTLAELEAHLAPYSEVGKYLTDIVRSCGEGRAPGWSRVIWDIAATARVINPDWVITEEAPSPILNDDLTWTSAPGRRRIQITRQLKWDDIFADFFALAREKGCTK